jgi:hypothetical protein
MCVSDKEKPSLSKQAAAPSRRSSRSPKPISRFHTEKQHGRHFIEISRQEEGCGLDQPGCIQKTEAERERTRRRHVGCQIYKECKLFKYIRGRDVFRFRGVEKEILGVNTFENFNAIYDHFAENCILKRAKMFAQVWNSKKPAVVSNHDDAAAMEVSEEPTDSNRSFEPEETDIPETAMAVATSNASAEDEDAESNRNIAGSVLASDVPVPQQTCSGNQNADVQNQVGSTEAASKPTSHPGRFRHLESSCFGDICLGPLNLRPPHVRATYLEGQLGIVATSDNIPQRLSVLEAALLHPESLGPTSKTLSSRFIVLKALCFDESDKLPPMNSVIESLRVYEELAGMIILENLVGNIPQRLSFVESRLC